MMKKNHVGGWLMFAALLFGSSVMLLNGCDSHDSCEGSGFRCTGELLDQCKDGTYVQIEDCTGKGMCREEHGHCHPGGAGGAGGSHHTGGDSAGGHSAGGAGGA